MSVEVLSITQTGDAHLPFVQDHLDTEIVVLDPALLIKGAELSYEFSKGGESHITYEGTALDGLKGVWFRKPRPIFKEDIPVPDDYKDYSHSGVTKHVDLLKAEFRDATWVPGYYEMLRASNKALQLQVAHSVGLNVPATLITSNSDRARQFLDTHNTCIVKPLASTHPNVDGSPTFFFTTKIDKSNPPTLDALHLAPAIFQEAIDPDYDVRVNVVGDKVFAASVMIDNLDESAVRDWRIGHYEGQMKLEARELPPEVAEKCVQLTQELGMSFGVIDLIKDRQGVYWFLEDNPNGQWAFVEKYTGQPIGKAVAELLVSKST